MEKTDKRIYGIDILRFLCMVMVCQLHFLGHGGILSNLEYRSTQYFSAWAIEIFSYIAVDTFGIISGYVGYGSNRYKTKSFLILWVQVLFYNVLFYIIAVLVGWDKISLRNIIYSLPPISTGEYWYFTSYFIVFLCAPLINRVVISSSNSRIIAYTIIGLPLYYYLRLIIGFPPYPLLLLYLYFFGAGIKKMEWRFPRKSLIFVCILFLGMNYILKIFFDEKYTTISYFFIGYSSPTTIIAASAMILLFRDITIHKRMQKLITAVTPSIFSIYLINENKYIRDFIITNSVIYLTKEPALILVVAIVFLSVSFAILSILIDQLRVIVFKILKVQSKIIPALYSIMVHCMKGISSKIEMLLTKKMSRPKKVV